MKTRREEENAAQFIDSFWSWLICCIAYLVGFICFGIQNNFGVFHSQVMQRFHSDNQQSAWLGSLAFGMMFFMSPISNAFCDVVAPCHVSLVGGLICVFSLVLSSFATSISVLYLTYSFCFGLGACLAYFPTVISLKTYFKRYFTLANGLSASGSGLGTVILAPILERSLEGPGLRWTYRLMAAIAVVMLFIQIIFIYIEKRSKKPNKIVNQQRLFKTIRETVFKSDIWTDKGYVVMVTSMAIFLFGYFVPYVHLVYLARKRGIPAMKATLLISYLSIASTVGKIVFGFLISFFQMQVRLVSALSMFCIGLSNFFVPFGKDYTSLCVYAIICGLLEGCITGQIAVTVLETVGSRRMSQGLAHLMAVNAIFTMAGPPVAGFIYDKTQSYDIAFHLSGCTSIVGASILLTLSLVDRKRLEARCQGSDCDTKEFEQLSKGAAREEGYFTDASVHGIEDNFDTSKETCM